MYAVSLDFSWWKAREMYLEGDPAELERLLRSDQKVTDETRTFLADIVAGTIKVKMTGKKNRKVSVSDEMKIGQELTLAQCFLGAPGAVEWLADGCGKEVGEVRKNLEAAVRRNDENQAKKYGVTKDTIRKIRTSKKFDKFSAKPVK